MTTSNLIAFATSVIGVVLLLASGPFILCNRPRANRGGTQLAAVGLSLFIFALVFARVA